MQVIFSTGNAEKFFTAKHMCDRHGIELVQQSADVNEIQEEDPKLVAVDKASKAIKQLGHPVVITDDSWAISGLNGFPGVYMHSINHWFTPEDFLRLTMPLKDRTVKLTQYLVYDDGTEQKIFVQQTNGTLLKEIRGTLKHASHTIIALDGEKGLSIAEAYSQAVDKSTRKTAQIWNNFAQWLKGE